MGKIGWQQALGYFGYSELRWLQKVLGVIKATLLTQDDKGNLVDLR